MKKRLFKLVVGSLVAISATLGALDLRDKHPDVYVVKKTDTLWDISAQFLNDPWLWPEIWQVNPQVNNPHLIYPGDILNLVYVDGKPRIRRKHGVIKLGPKIRVASRGDAIAALPLEAIKPFLVSARVVTDDQIDDAPYVLSSDGDHMIAGKDVRIYARGFEDEAVQSSYALFRRGGEYHDPVTGELLGIEAIHLGEAVVARTGDPTTLDISESVKETRKGDRLLPIDEQQLQPYFYPHAGKTEVGGQIISVYEGVTQIGQYHVVIINRGDREGIEVGQVFTVWRKGELVKDKYGSGFSDMVQLPSEKAGEIMVFRTFEKVSLALVMNATRPMHVLDSIKNPY